jgi:DNA invertase Pin-like site-specific DNA recombinase
VDSQATVDDGDLSTETRLDRVARSTRDLLNTLAAITGKKAGLRSLGDTWPDTTTSHGRLMLAVLGGLAEFERGLSLDHDCLRLIQTAEFDHGLSSCSVA